MDYTSHWPTVQFIPDSRASLGPRTDIMIPGHRVWTMDGLLTPAECDQLIATAEGLQFCDVKREYDPDYRDCDRVVFLCPSLAEQLWLRLLPCWHREDIQGVRPYGFGNHGIWKPAAANPCIRITRYSPGHHFLPHRDGSFVMTDDFRSVYTLQVYLNDACEFQGGQTNFRPAKVSESAAAGPVAAAVIPKSGLGLMFNHDIHHEGVKVESGTKYILRTDIMFQRLNGFDGPGHRAYLSDVDYQEAEELYRKSIKVQHEGDAAGSTAAYLAAQEMQARLPSIPLWQSEASSSSTVARLPDAVYIYLLGYLTLHELVAMRAINWRSRCAAEDSTLWAAHYQQQWPSDFQQERMQAAFHLMHGMPTGSEALLLDWYSLYRSRYHSERHFQIMVFDVGSAVARVAGIVKDQVSFPMLRRWRVCYDIRIPSLSMPSCIADALGHFWQAGSGMEQYLVGHELDHTQELFVVGANGFEEQRWAIPRNPAKGPLGTPDWKVMEVLLRHMVAVGLMKHNHSWYKVTAAHPAVMVVPAYFGDDQRQYLHQWLRKKVGFPCAILVDDAVAALAAQGVTTGIVICAGPLLCSVSAVVDGKVRRDSVAIHKTESPIQSLSPFIKNIVAANADFQEPLLDFILVHGAHAEACGVALSKDLPPGSKMHVCPPSTNPQMEISDLPEDLDETYLDICDWEPLKGAAAIAAVAKKDGFYSPILS